MAREFGGAFELGARLVGTAQPGEQLSAHCRKLRIVPERALPGQLVDEVQAACRTVGHADLHRPVEQDHGGRPEVGEHLVERRDARSPAGPGAGPGTGPGTEAEADPGPQ
ncbi:hypothetical protein [Streptomyces sp. NPDC001970]